MKPLLKQAAFIVAVIAVARLAQDMLPIPNSIGRYLP